MYINSYSGIYTAYLVLLLMSATVVQRQRPGCQFLPSIIALLPFLKQNLGLRFFVCQKSLLVTICDASVGCSTR